MMLTGTGRATTDEFCVVRGLTINGCVIHDTTGATIPGTSGARWFRSLLSVGRVYVCVGMLVCACV